MSEEIETIAAEPIPQPKRRGRPPRNAVQESPEDIISGTMPKDSSSTGPKERKPRKPKEEPFDRAGLAKKLQGWHQLAAMLLHTPELALDYDEAEMLVGDVENLTREYGISLSGKTAAWLGLAGSLAMVYAPRALIVAQKVQANKRRIPTPPEGVV
jgi:hypothetical protein